jgi:hypothetical protein
MSEERGGMNESMVLKPKGRGWSVEVHTRYGATHGWAPTVEEAARQGVRVMDAHAERGIIEDIERITTKPRP